MATRSLTRFYRSATAGAVVGGFTVFLDGRPIRTPNGSPLVVSTLALAESLAEEWATQGERVRPDVMTLTRLVNTALDRIGNAREAVIDEIMRYGASDLVCYHAEFPEELARRQERAWRPLLDWVAERFRARLCVARGVVPTAQPETALAALRAAILPLDDLGLAALASTTAATGSLVIGLALVLGRIGADEAWALSQIDEGFQRERWGRDAEDEARRERLRAEIAAAGVLARLRTRAG